MYGYAIQNDFFKFYYIKFDFSSLKSLFNAFRFGFVLFQITFEFYLQNTIMLNFRNKYVLYRAFTILQCLILFNYFFTFFFKFHIRLFLALPFTSIIFIHFI